VLYTDVDGTLVSHGGSLFGPSDRPSTRAADAIAALHRAGVQLVLVSGRTRDQLREVARLIGASAYIAELGAFVVHREAGEETLTTNFGDFPGGGTPVEAMTRSGAAGFLLGRYDGRLEPHTPWAFQGRRATMLLRGLVDEREATDALDQAGYSWVELVDNGRITRRVEMLDLPEIHAYHLLPRGVNKASGVRAHRERVGVVLDEAAAIGDSPSDLQMAPEVGRMALLGTAPDPSIDRAQREPARITWIPSPAGEGFAQAVEALLGKAPR
jgi:hydroxymethylpyrimidine pyrophosphatase-like HAD family hydrolase